MVEKAVWTPTVEQIKSTRLHQLMVKNGFLDYDEFYNRSIEDVSWFWGEVEKDLGIQWFKSYEKVLDLSRGKKWPDWFVNGELNITHNALDKWLDDPKQKEQTAIIWEGEEGNTLQYSYRELAELVNRFANGLIQQGIQKGDRVALYMPMIPEVAVAMLAICKIGAIITPVFSGYAADAVAKRLNDAEAKMLITADGFYRRGKVVSMKETADQAIKNCPSVNKVVVVRRMEIVVPWEENRDLEWTDLLTDHTPVTTLSMKSSDPILAYLHIGNNRKA